MVDHSRYDVSEEGAGLEEGILANKLGIRFQKDLDDAESLLFLETYEHLIEQLQTITFVFSLDFLYSIHKHALESLYSWAGETRTVNISKGGMMFAPVEYIGDSLANLETVLIDNMPNEADDEEVLAAKIAIIHNEANAVHPFRDGNGKTIRLYIDLMVVSLGYVPVDWGNQDDYIAACVEGMNQEHSSMVEIVRKGLKKQ